MSGVKVEQADLDTSFDRDADYGINRYVMANDNDPLRFLLDQIEQLQATEADVQHLADTFLYLARADDYEAYGFIDLHMLELYGPFMVFLIKVGRLASGMERGESDIRRSAFKLAAFFTAWIRARNLEV